MAGFARMVERAGVEAKFDFKAHPHMLRHACGFALANQRPRYAGAAGESGAQKIQRTVRYTELSSPISSQIARQCVLSICTGLLALIVCPCSAEKGAIFR